MPNRSRSKWRKLGDDLEVELRALIRISGCLRLGDRGIARSVEGIGTVDADIENSFNDRGLGEVEQSGGHGLRIGRRIEDSKRGSALGTRCSALGR